MPCLFFSFKVISLAPRALGILALDLAALAIRIALAGNLTRFYDKGLSIKHEHVLFDL